MNNDLIEAQRKVAPLLERLRQRADDRLLNRMRERMVENGRRYIEMTGIPTTTAIDPFKGRRLWWRDTEPK